MYLETNSMCRMPLDRSSKIAHSDFGVPILSLYLHLFITLQNSSNIHLNDLVHVHKTVNCLSVKAAVQWKWYTYLVLTH